MLYDSLDDQEAQTAEEVDDEALGDRHAGAATVGGVCR
jgi:hypothetical protein